MPSLFGIIGKKLLVEAPKVYVEVVFDLGIGFVKSFCGVSLYISQELEEIDSLNKIAASVFKKSSTFVSDESVCEVIKEPSIKALSKFKNNLPSEAVKVAVGVDGTLVCKKTFLPRFRDVLMDACFTITYCS